MPTTYFDARTPLTLVTGWLGAGKTTLLNRILADPGGRRFAVLVNEFGDIGIDHRLIVRADEDIVELSNGCVCCSVRGDLVQALERLRKRRFGGLLPARKFDHALLETTGIAEPAPLLRTFLVEESVAMHWRIASTLCLVDAVHAERAFAEPSACDQMALADGLLLAKTSLVSEPALAKLHGRLETDFPGSWLAMTSSVATEDLLRDREPRAIPSQSPSSGHGNLAAITLTEDAPLDELKAHLWLDGVAKLQQEGLVRWKGFLNLKDVSHRGVLQGTYELYTVSAGDPWGEAPRRTEIVLIGRSLDEAMLRRGLTAARA